MTVLAVLICIITAAVLWPSPADVAAVSAGVGDGRPADPVPDADDRGTTPGEARVPAATVDDAADALVLCALVMRAGLGPVEALEAVAPQVGGVVGQQLKVVASAHRWGQDSGQAWSHVGPWWRPAAVAWQAAERSGAAPAGVVLAAAERLRRSEAHRIEAAVQRAGVLLVLPLGTCFLPGFAGTTVVPIVLHLARSGLGLG